MSRRQTLATLSPSQLNTKPGGGNTVAGRLAKDGAQPSKTRKSMAVGAQPAIGFPSVRRSSTIGGKPGGPKQDPRPLQNRQYQAACIQRIITYLATHSFPAAVSPQTLASPTGKDFATIVTFLLQQVDPTFKIQGKVEDEVPAFFKRLSYPFQISKSALFAVGSPHSWPAVLGALTWLVELLEYAEKTGGAPAGLAAEADTKTNLGFLAASYDAFMHGHDEICEKLDSSRIEKYTQSKAERAKRIEEMRKEKADLQAELEQVRSLRDPVVEAQAKREEKQVDLQKFEQLIAGLQNMKQLHIRKVAEKTSELQATQGQIEARLAEAEQLRQRVAGQTVNKADVNRMTMERKRLKEVLDTEKAKNEELEAKLHEQEVEIIHCLQDLDSVVERYNRLAHRLKLIPATNKRAEGINYELRINRDASTQLEFCNLDLKGVIKPGLERVCATYIQRACELSNDLVSLREARTARLERNAESREQSAALEAQIAQLEAQLQAAKDAREEKSKRLLAQADAIKAQVDDHRNAVSMRTESMKERLSSAQAEYEQAKRDSEAELVRLDAEVKRALRMLTEYKEHMSALFVQTAGVMQRVKAEVMASNAVHAFEFARS